MRIRGCKRAAGAKRCCSASSFHFQINREGEKRCASGHDRHVHLHATGCVNLLRARFCVVMAGRSPLGTSGIFTAHRDASSSRRLIPVGLREVPQKFGFRGRDDFFNCGSCASRECDVNFLGPEDAETVCIEARDQKPVSPPNASRRIPSSIARLEFREVDLRDLGRRASASPEMVATSPIVTTEDPTLTRRAVRCGPPAGANPR